MMREVLRAETCDVVVGVRGQLWVNLDGRCVMRVASSGVVQVDDPVRGCDVVYEEGAGVVPAAARPRLTTTLGALEFESGQLVKVGGMRPEYMGGHDLIMLVRELGALLAAHEAKLGGST